MNLFCRLSPLRENCLTAPAIKTCNHPSSYRTQRRPLRYLHSARSSSSKGLMKLLTYFHWSRTRIDPVSHSSSSLFSIDSTKHFFWRNQATPCRCGTSNRYRGSEKERSVVKVQGSDTARRERKDLIVKRGTRTSRII